MLFMVGNLDVVQTHLLGALPFALTDPGGILFGDFGLWRRGNGVGEGSHLVTGGWMFASGFLIESPALRLTRVWRDDRSDCGTEQLPALDSRLPPGNTTKSIERRRHHGELPGIAVAHPDGLVSASEASVDLD